MTVKIVDATKTDCPAEYSARAISSESAHVEFKWWASGGEQFKCPQSNNPSAHIRTGRCQIMRNDTSNMKYVINFRMQSHQLCIQK